MEESSDLGIWLIILVVFLIFVALTVILPTALVRSRARLSRKAFAIRFFSGLGVAIVLGAAIGIVAVVNDRDFDERTFDRIFNGFQLIFVFLVSFWSAKRAQDIGWTKWWNLLYGIPLLNFVYLGTMLFVRSAEAPAQDASPSGEAVLADV